jgi:hypothetical protein
MASVARIGDGASRSAEARRHLRAALHSDQIILVPSSPLDAQPDSEADREARREAELRGDPYLLWYDGSGRQQIFSLAEEWDRATIGRGLMSDICLNWDEELSRVHAQLELLTRTGPWSTTGSRATARSSTGSGWRDGACSPTATSCASATPWWSSGTRSRCARTRSSRRGAEPPRSSRAGGRVSTEIARRHAGRAQDEDRGRARGAAVPPLPRRLGRPANPPPRGGW